VGTDVQSVSVARVRRGREGGRGLDYLAEEQHRDREDRGSRPRPGHGR